MALGQYVIVIERREDGGLRVYSDDIPGLLLSHSNADAVLSDISPVLQVLLADNPSPVLSAKER